MTYEVAVIPGDGVGREVVPAAIDVLRATGVDFSFVEAEAGDAVADDTGRPLPEETSERVVSADATLFGAAGETAADVILPLRAAVGSFVNVRPARAYPGVDALRPETDVVFLRENTEGVYTGEETRDDGRATLTRIVTEDASRRLAEFACDFVTSRGETSFTVVHKANVMAETDGLFLETIQSVAEEKGVTVDPVLMDAFATTICLTPERYDVVVCPNLAGDVLSDLAGGLVGGLGLLPSANIGPVRGLFEPVHGTAPDIAGRGVANPVAAIQSSAMMLGFLGEEAAQERVESAVQQVLHSGPRTPDLGGSATTETVTDAIVDQLNWE